MCNRRLHGLVRRIAHRPERFRPTVFALEQRATPAVLTFQQGTDGYTGAQDTQIFSATPDANFGADTEISVDQNDGGGSRQALIRFDNIIGSGAGQIPLGSVINSATLTFDVTSATDSHPNLGLYRMLIDWNQSTVTWNSLGTLPGLQVDGTDANFPADGLLNDSTSGTGKAITARAGVQAWANGATNFGWGIAQDSGNGWDFVASENTTAANRPVLTVDFTAPSGAGQFVFGAASYSVAEGAATATITVTRLAGTTGAVGVNYAATASSASAADFTATSGTLNFASGDVSKTFTVAIANDQLLEGNETINLALTNPTGAATLGNPATCDAEHPRQRPAGQ
jgi:hypothetical protein